MDTHTHTHSQTHTHARTHARTHSHTHTLTLQLTPVELDFLTSHSSAALSEFEKVSSSPAAGEKVLAMAGSQIERAQK